MHEIDVAFRDWCGYAVGSVDFQEVLAAKKTAHCRENQRPGAEVALPGCREQGVLHVAIP